MELNEFVHHETELPTPIESGGTMMITMDLQQAAMQTEQQVYKNIQMHRRLGTPKF